jgi:biotin carboxyl carrier protein
VIEVVVNEGDDVREGDLVAVLETMKMQTRVAAPRPGSVHAVRVKAGDVVEAGQALATLR